MTPAAAQSDNTFGRLTHFSMTGLFGHREISFETRKAGPTLLTGVNGSGKSTVLRCISAVGSGQWVDLLSVPFSNLALTFASGDSVEVSPADQHQEALDIHHGDLKWTLHLSRLTFPTKEELSSRFEARRLPDGRWEHEDKIYSQATLRQILAIRALAHDEDAPWVPELSDRFPVLYVPDQRLGGGPLPTEGRFPAYGRGRGLNSVDQYARDLKRIIADGLSQYGTHSQALDRAFPQGVVSSMAEHGPVDLDAIRKLLDRVGHERNELEIAGLLEAEEDPVEFNADHLSDPHVAPVLQIYAEQTLEKFAVLAHLKLKLTTFANFLNSHYRDKLIFVTPTSGFTVAVLSPKKEAPFDIEFFLRPSELSSGEQQMLILAYEVIFRTQPNTLILIDEPELSLHVLWQSTLVDDLAEMGSINRLNFILATHSPTLIADREELRESLDPDNA